MAAAEFTIPRFEMATLGRPASDDFSLTSVISADFSVSGGYKYGLSFGFSFNHDTVSAPPDQTTLNFRMVRATIRDLFNSPLELTYFMGEGDVFCSGDEFTTRFGYAPMGSDYKGLFYFPEGIGGDLGRTYNGIYGVNGTGISLAFTRGNIFVPMIYLYQSTSPIRSLDGSIGGIPYSGDLRFLVNQEKYHIEAFAGASYKDVLMLRGGVLAHFYSGENIDFLIQGGMSGWNMNDDLTIDAFYFLMEPRLRFGNFRIFTTLFIHPVVYNSIVTAEEQGKIDINLKLFGQLQDTDVSAGVETTVELKMDKMEDLIIKVSPFISLLGGGLQWDAKLRINVLGFDKPDEMFELFIGVSSSF